MAPLNASSNLNGDDEEGQNDDLLKTTSDISVTLNPTLSDQGSFKLVVMDPTDLPSLADSSECSIGSHSLSTPPASPSHSIRNRRRNKELQHHPSPTPPPASMISLPHPERRQDDGVEALVTPSTGGDQQQLEDPSLSSTGGEKRLTSGAEAGAGAESIDCTDIILDSLSCITSILTCTKVEGNTRKSWCLGSTRDIIDDDENKSVAKTVDGSTTTTSCGDDDIDSDLHLQRIRECIEFDILKIIGCTADSAELWMDNIGKSFLCEPSAKNSISTRSLPLTHQKRGNRNVCVRKKAERRIRRLRKGGLSRPFSLVPVAEILDEDMKKEAARRRPSSNITFLKKMRSASCVNHSSPVDTTATTAKRTSFVRQMGQIHHIQSTRSAELVSENSGRTTATHRRDVMSDALPYFSDTTSSSIITVPTADSECSGVDLYYDSDPGCSVNEELGADVDPVSRCADQINNNGISNHNGNGDVEALGGCPSDDTTRMDNVETVLNKKKKKINVKDIYKNHQSKALKASKAPPIQDIRETRSLLDTMDVRTFDINNNDMVTRFIEELTSGFIVLLWHPNSTQIDRPTSNPPRSIQAWFEMGSCLKSSLVQPKFMWRRIPSLHHQQQQENQGVMFQTPHQVELLNIVRVIVPSTFDRNEYPFVRQSTAFSVVTSTEETFVFEAATEAERDRFVHGLKIVIARLASKIIVGDKDVFEEFFSPWGTSMRRRVQKKPSKKNLERGKEKRRSSGNFVTATINEQSGRKDELWGTS